MLPQWRAERGISACCPGPEADSTRACTGCSSSGDRMFVSVTATGLDALLASLSPDGRDFERLVQWFLRSDPEWAVEYRTVWLWDEWPGRWGPDKGVDLVAETFDDKLVAIQAKNYGPAHSITKRDLDTFLSESNRAVISSRLLIATTDGLASSAKEVMAGQEKPVSTCLLSRIQVSPAAWPPTMAALEPSRPPRLEPRKHQNEALAAIDKWALTGASRGQVIMACGTGKSLVGVQAADRLDARRVLILAPTLDLLRQLSRDWARNAHIDRRLFHISSDSDRLEDDITRGDELATVRSTDPNVIAERLRTAPNLAVFCTYNSSKALADAMGAVPDVEFDLAVVDEAHRCAGAATSTYKTILKPDAIRARRRLFFTATPVVFSTHAKSRASNRNVQVASMDDHDLFGPVLHRLSFAEAISRGLLCRYQVAVIPIQDDEVHRLIEERRLVTADGDRALLAGSLATQIACARAMRRYGCRRVVAFQPTITQSRRFADHFPVAAALLPDHERPDGELWCHHVDGGSMPFPKRARLVEHFRSSHDPEQYRLLSNVRLLAEGVDVPGIDAIAFVDTRRGHAQIVQAVGRAVRTAPGKKVGTIVLPIVLRKDEHPDAALARTEHRMVVDVLGALRSHDPEITKSLDTLRFGLGPDSDPGSASGRFVVDAPVDVGEEFADAVEVALANALSVVPASKRSRPTRARQPVERERQPPTPEEMFFIGLGELRKTAMWRLLPRVPPTTAANYPLGPWWDEAKRRWAAGDLDVEDKRLIAESVSWLAADVAGAQRAEMIALTEHSVPEQVVAQLQPDGILTTKQTKGLIEPSGDPEAFLDELQVIHDAVTHPGMWPYKRVRYVMIALHRLTAAIARANRTPEPPYWHWTTQRQIAIDGFVYALKLANAGTSPFDAPRLPPHYDLCPDAHALGVAAAKPLRPLVHHLRAFRFNGDEEAVADRLRQEADMPPDDRFDALAWNIYMLVRASGGDWGLAESLALDGHLAQRRSVRTDRLRSALARIARDDAIYDTATS